MDGQILSLALGLCLNIAGDTEIHSLHSLAYWIKAKIGSTPAHGFPINPSVLRTPLVYDRNF
jgi:hypothetical protein